MTRMILGMIAAVLLPLAAGAQQPTPTPAAVQPPAATAAQTPAQPDPNPLSNVMRRVLDRRAKAMIPAAELMPVDKYSYRPTPDQMTYAHLEIHIAETNNFLCSGISGTAAPTDQKLADTDTKEKLVAAVKSSFEYCTQAMAKVDDSKLSEQVPFFGGDKISRAGAMVVLASALSDHYGAQAMYLRLNGIVPPTGNPKKD
jgi:hypothetical protein